MLFRSCAGHSNAVRSVDFSPDGKILASSGDDGTIRVWDANNGKCFQKLQRQTRLIHSVTFSPDGKILASGDEHGSILLWETQSYTCKFVLRNPRPYEGINITSAEGFTDAQRFSLISLGAIDHSPENLEKG